jgi:ATP-dependent DNA helicase RecG
VFAWAVVMSDDARYGTIGCRIVRDVRELLDAHEGPRLDFKRDLSSMAKVVRTLAAMGNTAGGHVVVGVDDDRTVPGLVDPLKDEEALSRAVADSIEPLLPVEISVQHVGTANVLVAEVLRWKGPFGIEAEGEEGFYKRVGSTNQRLGSTEIDELRREIAGKSFDAMPRAGTSRNDLDPARLRAYLRDRGIKTDSPRLRSLELLAEYAGGSVVASNAGLILFGKDAPRAKFVPDARVRCARFRGTTKAEILDRLDIDGTVLDAVAETEAFIARNTRTGGRFPGKMQREDLPEYAPITIRELLVNAIAHTDYALAGSQILVAIFDDRVEIQNPGSFVYGSTVETIKQGISRVRNRAIVRILRELNLMEILGSGYERISTTFDDGYPEPDWRELGVVVRVAIPAHPFFTAGNEGSREGDEGDREGNDGDRLADGPSMSAAQRAAWVLVEIDAGRPVTNRYLSRALGISLATAERLTGRMQRDGAIRWSGTRRSGRFRRI